MYQVVIETPKSSRIKRNETGGIDLISPFSCPFNYGRVIGFFGKDGDPLDAVLLGEREAYNSIHVVPLIGVVRFLDAGNEDHKLIFSNTVATEKEKKKLKKFFSLYAQIKNLTQMLQFQGCSSKFLGLEWGTIEIEDYCRR